MTIKESKVNKNAKELLDLNISRYDGYINSAGARAGFVVAFNTFILGSLILKSPEIIGGIQNDCLANLAIVSAAVCLIGVAGSLLFCFFSTMPYLISGNRTGQDQSLLFFGTVAEMTRDQFRDSLNALNEVRAQEDLESQVYELASCLTGKYRHISNAFLFTFFGSLLGMVAMFILIFIDFYL